MQDQQAGTDSIELSRYVVAVRHYWPLVVIITVLAAAAAILYATVSAQKVTASATVNVSAITSDAFVGQRSASGLIDAVTEEQVARSSDVLERAAATVGGGTTVRDLRRNMTAEVLPEATVMRFTYTAGTAAEAVDGANALADSYIDARTSNAAAKVERILAQLQSARDELRSELVDLNRVTATASPSSRKAAEAAAERSIINSQLDSLLTEMNDLAAIDTNGGTVVSGAEDNPVSVSPRPRLWGQIGAALGLVLGLIAALVVGMRDRRVRDARSVLRAGGGPVLGRLSSPRGRVPADDEDRDALSAARERLLAALPPAAALVVLDLTGGERPSDVPANLTLSFVEIGRPVTLVLPDWDDAVVQHLGQAMEVTPAWAVVDGVREARLDLRHRTPAAVIAGGGGEAMSDPSTMHPDTAATTTIIGIPSASSRSMVLARARRSDGVVLVVAAKRTSSELVSSMVADVAAMGVEVIGTIVVPGERGAGTGQRTPSSSG